MKEAVLATTAAAALLATWTSGAAAQGMQLNFANAGAIEGDPATIEIIREFEAETGHEVEIVPIPGPRMIEVNYGTLARGETTYDVHEALGQWLPDFISNGWIVPLDDVFPAWQQAAYPKDILDLASDDEGRIYSIPWYMQPTLAFYRSDLLEEANASAPTTLDEFVELCKELTVDTNGDGIVDRYGFVYGAAAGAGAGMADTYARFLYAFHGRLFDEAGEPVFDSGAGIDALQLIVDLRNEHECVPESVIDYQEGTVAEFWYNGNAAMMWHEAGHVIANALESAHGDALQLARLPSADGAPPASLSQVVYPVVNANSENLEAAKQLAAHLGGYGSQWLSFYMEFNVPTHAGVFDSPFIRENMPFPDEIGDAVSRGRLEAHRGHAEVEEIISREARAAIIGDKSAEEAITDAVAAIKRRKL